MDEFHGVVDDLITLVLVIEAGGFTAASLRHNIPVSRLSRRVAALEKRLGASLLVRTSRGFKVTEVGASMYQHGLKIRATVRSAMIAAQDALDEPAGHLRVACPVALSTGLVSRVCVEFVKLHPKVSLTLNTTDGRALPLDGSADLLLQPSIGPLPDSNWVSRKLGDYPYILVATPDLHRSLGAPDTPAALANCPAVGWTFSPSASVWPLKGPDDAVFELPVQTRFTSDSLLQIQQAAKAGLGVARLPIAMCARDLQEGVLQTVAPGWAPATISIYALYPSRRNLTLAGRRLLTMIADAITPVPVAI